MSEILTFTKPAATGRLIGYARVSTQDQNLDMQRAALRQAGCQVLFEDKGMSGGLASRPGLDQVLDILQPGEVLVVYRLDRLGRSVSNLSDLLVRLNQGGVHFRSLTEQIDTTTPGGKLIFHVFAAVAEFQRDLIRENTVHGLACARGRGVTLGRPRLLTPEQAQEAAEAVLEGEALPDVAKRLHVSLSTLLRALELFQFT